MSSRRGWEPLVCDRLPGTDLLQELLRRFEVLQGQMQLLTAFSEQLKLQQHWTPDLERQWDDQRSALLDQLYALAQEAARCPTQHREQWVVKAKILLEWCVVDDGDIVHDLAASLSRDIWRAAAAQACPP